MKEQAGAWHSNLSGRATGGAGRRTIIFVLHFSANAPPLPSNSEEEAKFTSCACLAHSIARLKLLCAFCSCLHRPRASMGGPMTTGRRCIQKYENGSDVIVRLVHRQHLRRRRRPPSCSGASRLRRRIETVRGRQTLAWGRTTTNPTVRPSARRWRRRRRRQRRHISWGIKARFGLQSRRHANTVSFIGKEERQRDGQTTDNWYPKGKTRNNQLYRKRREGFRRNHAKVCILLLYEGTRKATRG